ncbi:Sperm associated antigen 1 [Homalodisca vitripennis]|nr:Sperm associated antigen 1 [Homalodisca vitripennis]
MHHYLKQCKYAAALDDANKTLELDPYNIKALFRRGVALNHKNEFKRALDDIKAVLMKQPKHVLAQHMYRELREQINLLPKSIREDMMSEGMVGEKFDHPPYSLDLASDYHLFLHMKQELGGHRFETDDEVMATFIGENLI